MIEKDMCENMQFSMNKTHRLLNADLFLSITGKGDLVGCDISQHLAACSNGQGGSGQHDSRGQDVIVKSSSDVKVMPFDYNCTGNGFSIQKLIKAVDSLKFKINILVHPFDSPIFHRL